LGVFELDVTKEGCNKTGATASGEAGIATNGLLMIPTLKLR
jgi:hypothetical protein